MADNMQNRLYQGPYGIVITPFDENGDVDYEKLEKQIDRVCGSSIDGIVVCGSTGEFIELDAAANMAIMRLASDVNCGRKKLIVGATAADYKACIEYLKWAEKCGANGALTAPPYYFPLNDEEVVEFYRMISREWYGVPIIAYQIPQFTSPISLYAYEKILELENIKGLKNSSGDFNQLMHEVYLRNLKREDFSVLTGSDESIYATLSVGGDGNFTALAYLLPEVIAYIYRCYGRESFSLNCQLDLLPLLRLAGSVTFPYGYKLIGEAAGFDFGKSRQAIPEQTVNRGIQIREEMEKIVYQLIYRYDESFGRIL